MFREHKHCCAGARSLPSKIRARLVRLKTVREGCSAQAWVSGAVSGASGYPAESNLLLHGAQVFSRSHLTSWQG